MRYRPLDASSEELATSPEPLHNVPWYDAERYRLIADIPPHSGRSAYDNETCPNCGRKVAANDKAKCSWCRGVLWNRPIVRGRGRPRLIKRFLSSYRRMRSDRPAATITTNSSHVGSDWKIHPFENRVLSGRECADPNIAIGITCVRIPVLRAHCVSVTFECETPISPDEVRAIIVRLPRPEVSDTASAIHPTSRRVG